jgi:hypothetical protein
MGPLPMWFGKAPTRLTQWRLREESRAICGELVNVRGDAEMVARELLGVSGCLKREWARPALASGIDQ